MYASIGDGTLLSGGFSSISEGLHALGITSVELGINREYRLNAIKPTKAMTRIFWMVCLLPSARHVWV